MYLRIVRKMSDYWTKKKQMLKLTQMFVIASQMSKDADSTLGLFQGVSTIVGCRSEIRGAPHPFGQKGGTPFLPFQNFSY
jgi:hypothetical protein